MNGLTLRSVYDKDLNKEDGAGKTAPFSLDRGSSQLKESSFKNGKVDFNFVTNPAFAKEAKTELNNLSSELANKKAENEKLNEFYNSRDGEKSQTAIAPAGGIKAQSSDGKPVDTTAKQTILSANAKSAIEEFRNTTQATYNSIKQRAEDAQNRLTGVQNDILNDIQNNSFTTPKEALAVTGQKAKSLVSAVQDQKAKQKILDQYDYIKEYDNFTTDVNTGNIIKDKVNTAKANYTVGRISQDQSKAWSDYLNNPTKENKNYALALSEIAEQAQINNKEALNSNGLLTKSFANYVPQLVDQLKYEAAGAAIGLAATQSLQGAKAGAAAGSGLYSFNNMRGAAFYTLISNGVDEETARKAASDEALISGMIEMADTFIDLSLILGSSAGKALLKGLGANGLVDKVAESGLKNAAGKAIDKFAAKSALNKVLVELGRYGLDVLGEGEEEALQEDISTANLRRVLSGDADLGPVDLAKKALQVTIDANLGNDPEAKASRREARIEGMKVAAVSSALGLGGTQLANTASNTVTGLNLQKGMSKAEKSETQKSLIESGLEAPEDTDDYRAAAKADKKYQKSGSLSNAEVGNLYNQNRYQQNVENAELNKASGKTIYDVTGVKKDAPGAEKKALDRLSKVFTNAESTLSKTDKLTNADKFNLNIAKRTMVSALDNSWYNGNEAQIRKLVDDVNKINKALGIEETVSVDKYIQPVQTEAPKTETPVQEAPQTEFVSQYETATTSNNITYPTVGKKKGDSYSFHKTYVEENSPLSRIIEDAPSEIADSYDTVSVDNNGVVTLTKYDDFNGSEAPVAVMQYKGTPMSNGEYKWSKVKNPNSVLVDKYNYVPSEYSDFDVEEARNYETYWKGLARQYGISYDPQRIENADYFNSIMDKIAEAQKAEQDNPQLPGEGEDVVDEIVDETGIVKGDIDETVDETVDETEEQKAEEPVSEEVEPVEEEVEDVAEQEEAVEEATELTEEPEASEPAKPETDKKRKPYGGDIEKNKADVIDYANTLSKAFGYGDNWLSVATDMSLFDPETQNGTGYIKHLKAFYARGFNNESFMEDLSTDPYYNRMFDLSEPISRDAKLAAWEAGREGYADAMEAAESDDFPIHIAEDADIDVLERIIPQRSRYNGFTKTHKGEGQTLFPLIDLNVEGDNLYATFRDMPADNTGRKAEIIIRDYKNKTASDIIDYVNKNYGENALGENFTNAIKEFYKTELGQDTKKKPKKTKSAKSETETKAPAAQNEVKAENLTTDEQKPQSELNPTQQAVANGLKTHDRVVVNGRVFSISKDDSGYKDSIRVHPTYVIIDNARSTKYDGGPFATRQEAVDDIVAVAKWFDDSAYQKDVEGKENNNDTGSDNGLHSVSEPTEVRGAESERDSARDSSEPGVMGASQVGETENKGNEEDSNGRVPEGQLHEEENGSGSDANQNRGTGETGNGTRGNDVVITEDPLIVNRTAGERYKANVEAIKTVQKITNEGRDYATTEEQKAILGYTGWGGLKEIFTDSKNASSRKKQAELKELLGANEYKALEDSTLSAFYTPLSVVNDIYDAVKQMGFTTGTILEPSCGTGIFLGAMPEDMRGNVIAVEKEPFAGTIAKLLYPSAQVNVAGFEDVDIPNNSVDLIVGNVPFVTNGTIYDKNYRDFGKQDIHNYFILKGLELLKPDGIMAVLTSTTTLDGARGDGARKLMASKARLVDAFRLPAGTFGSTSEAADLLIFQKKSAVKSDGKDYAFIVNKDTSADLFTEMGELNGIKVNKYFETHPDHVLGTVSKNSMGRPTVVSDGRKLSDIIKEKVPKNIISTARQNQHNVEVANTFKITEQNMELSDKNAALSDAALVMKYGNGSTILKGGKLYTIEEGKLVAPYKTKGGETYTDEDGVKHKLPDQKVPIEEGSKDYRRLVALNELSDAYQELLNAMYTTEGEEALEAPRKKFNDLYDAFQVDFQKRNYKAKTVTPGYLNDAMNSRLMNDPRMYQLTSTEESYKEDGVIKYKKGDVFSKRTVKVVKVITSVDNARDAMFASMNVNGRIDLDYMAQLYKKPKEQIVEELGDSIFELPNVPGSYVTSSEYLSGNVKAKLAEAEELNKDGKFNKQVEALKKVIPADVPSEQIYVQLGSAWVGTDVVKDFIRDLAQMPDASPKVEYLEYSSLWDIDIPSSPALNRWRTPEVSAEEILKSKLNGQAITVYYPRTYRDEKPVVNREASDAADLKAEELNDYFKEWIFKDPERRDRVVKDYNDKFNNYVPRVYDGSHLTMPGSTINLYPHQKNSIMRMISDRSTLLAHPAGSGKTFEMIGAAHEMKRLGMANKILFVVPNHKLEDFTSDYYKMYPGAKILTVHTNEWSKKSREQMIRRIQTTDPEVIIIRHSSFESFGFSKDYEAQYIQKRITELEEAIRQANDQKMSARDLTAMKKRLANYEANMQELLDRKTDDIIPFDETGIDAIFVDEAHNFKNLENPTREGRVAGANTGDSKKATRMHMATELMAEGGRKTVFATATPMSNTIGEMYNMIRYMRPDVLAQYGISSYDAFINTFATKVNSSEVNTTGTGVVMKTRYSKFNNIPELIKLFKSFADIIQQEDLNLKGVPNAKEVHVTAEASDLLKKWNQYIEFRKTQIKGQKLQKGEENHLTLYGDAKMAALDLRLVYNLMIDKGILSRDVKVQDLDLPGSKINKLVDSVFKEYTDSNETKGTQVIFLDRGVPAAKVSKKKQARYNELVNKYNSGTITETELAELEESMNSKRYNFDLYEDIKNKLINKGVAPEEIAFIQDTQSGNTDKKKAELFERVRNGDVRVLIGSTSMMGEGMNVQDKAVAVHNVNAPDRPSDIIQRNARVVRQQNENSDVRVYYYSTLNSYDAASWESLNRKNKAFSSIMKGDETIRDIEDLGEDSFANMSVEAANNPLIFERSNLLDEIRKLETKKKNKLREVREQEDFIRGFERARVAKQQAVDLYQGIADVVKKNPDPNITINGKKCETLSEASKALTEWASKKLNGNDYNQTDYYKVGAIHGVPIEARQLDIYGTFNIRAANNNRLSVGAALTREEGGRRYENTDNLDKFSTAMLRLNNKLSFETQDGLGSLLEKAKKDLNNYDAQYEYAKNNPAAPYTAEEEDVLREKKSRLAAVESELAKIGGRSTENPFARSTYSFKEVADEKHKRQNPELYEMMASKKTQSKAASRAPASESGLYKPSVAPTVTNTKPTETASDLIKLISRDFKIAAERGGKYTKRKAFGYYTPYRPSIHTRDYQDLSTALHEFGHGIDDRYKFRDNFIDELNRLALKFDSDTINAYGGNMEQLRHEAVAEMIRLYMLNPAGAAEFDNEVGFIDIMEHELSKRDLELLRSYGERVRAVTNVDVINRVNSTIKSRADKPKDTRDLQMKLADAEAEYFNEFAPLGKMNAVIEKESGQKLAPSVNAMFRAEQSRKAPSIAGGLIMNGLHAPNSKEMLLPSFVSLLNAVANDRESFAGYLKNRHAMEWWEQGKQVYNGDMDSIERMREADAAYLEKYPHFERVAENIYDWFNAFEQIWAVDTGLVDQETFNMLRTLNPYYVPNIRVKERGSAEGSGRGGEVLKHSSAHGSDLDTYDPIETMMYDVARIVNLAMKNEVYKSMHKLYNNPDTASAMGMFISEVGADEQRNTVDVTDKKSLLKSKISELLLKKATAEDIAIVNDPSSSRRAVKAVYDKYGVTKALGDIDMAIEDYVVGFTNKKRTSAADEFDVRLEDGEIAHYRVINPTLANMFVSMSNDTRAQKSWTDFLVALKRTTTTLTTSLNPFFAIQSNPFRDAPLAYIKGSESNMIKYTRDLVKAAFDIVKKGEYYRIASNAGMIDNAFTNEPVRKFIRVVNEASGKKPNGIKERIVYLGDIALGKLEDLNDVVEMAPRLAEFTRTYSKAISEGYTEEDAMIIAERAAAELTTDFGRKGRNELLNSIQAVTPYMRAGFNGAYDIMNAYTGKGAKYSLMSASERKRALAETWAKTVAILVIPTIIAALAHRDDDEYKKLPEYYKAGYWLIHKPGEEHGFIRIPKPQMLGFFFSNTVDAVINEILESEDDNGKMLTDAFFDTVIPSYSTVLEPVFDVGRNETWYGGSIVSSVFDDKLEDRSTYDEVYDDTTSRLAVAIANLIPEGMRNNKYRATPKGIEYLIDQYTGVIGDILLPATTPAEGPAEAIKGVFTRRMSVDSLASNKYPTEFYDISGKLTATDNNDVMKKLFQGTGKTVISELEELGVKVKPGGALDRLRSVKNVTEKGTVSYGISPSKRLSELWKEIRETNNDRSLTGAERKEKINACREEINAITEECVRIYNEVASKYEGKEVTTVQTDTQTPLQKKAYALDSSLTPNTLELSFTYGKTGEKKTVELDYKQAETYQTTYEDTYWGYLDRTFDNAGSDAERTALMKAAKNAAKAKAQNTVVPGSNSYFDKFKGVDEVNVIRYKALVDMTNDDDGSTTQNEIIDAIKSMNVDGHTAYILFHSKYESDKNNPWKKYK